MIHIAICDDDVFEGEKISRAVGQCSEEMKIVCKKSVFSNSRALLHEVEDGLYFDLFILDIEMPELDGINLTERIKRILPDALIVFLTSYEKYVYESFKVQPYRFVPKRYADDMFPAAVKDALKLIAAQEDKYMIIENQRVLEKVHIKHIAYIWHRGKYAYVEKTNGNVAKVRKTLKQVYEELPDEDFVWADRGCIINISKIAQITGEMIVLVNGARIDVNKDRLTGLKNRVRQYWVEKVGI